MLCLTRSQGCTRSTPMCTLAVLIVLATQVVAAPPTYIEDFTTKQFNDASTTTADWDSVSGKLTLFPFLLSVEGSIATSTFAWEADVSGNFVYVAAMPPEVIDITDPTTPVMVGTLPTAGDSRDLRALGNYAYVADGASGLTVINITTPSAATFVTTKATPGFASGIDVVSINVFVAMGTSGLRTYSITTRTNPVMLSDYNTPGTALKVDVVGDYAYVADADSGLTIVDISDPSLPSLAGRFVTGGSANDVVVKGEYAYVADGSAGLIAVDITDPTAPSLAGSLAIVGAVAIDVDGDYLYVAVGVGGLHAVDISDPASPAFLYAYNSPGTASGIALAGDIAYLADGNSGLAAVRISDLVRALSVLGSYNPPSQPLDIAVSGDLMFIPTFLAGVEIFDVSDPTTPTLIGTYAQLGAKCVDVTGDLLLVQIQSVGLHVIDISDPTAPSLLGTYANSTWSTIDIRVDGDYVYAPNYGTGLQVINISNPASPSLVATYNTPSSARDVVIEGEYAFVADYATLQILNVRNPAAPFFVGQYNPIPNVQSAAVSGDILYVGTSSSVMSVDISNPAIPILLDTYFFAGTSLPQEMIASGDALFVAEFYKGFHVFDVSDPTDLTVALKDPIPETLVVAVDGDYAYMTRELGTGQNVVIQRVRGREFDVGNSIAISKKLNTGSQFIMSGRIVTTQVDIVKWELTANGGTSWAEVQPGADFEVLFPGTDLRWRATLSQEQAGVNPYVTDLKVEWLLEAPFIDTIEDFPNDDGKYIRIHWARSGFDALGSVIPILEYAIYRKIDGTSDYDHVGTIPATTDVDYAFTVPTLKDSSTAGINYSTFVIQARTASPLVFYDSAPDSGYSIDNLIPSPPMGFAAVFEAGIGNVLTWEPSDAEDFDQFRIYRGDSEDFTATVDDLVHTTRDNVWEDRVESGGTYHYKITVVDMAGNESAAASSSVTADAPEPDLPRVVTLGNNYPNPFNPSTIIPYALPIDGYVSLVIYDAAGREVTVLIDEVRPAGRWSAEWNGEDRHGRQAPSGTYFYRLQAGSTTLSGKMVLLK